MTEIQIRYFLEAARCLNFTQAANNLFITQQVMSSQLRALEAELNLSLFDRSNRRKIRLTKSGEILYQRLSIIMQAFDNALEEARAVSENEKLQIRIGIQDVDPIVREFVPHISDLGNKEVEFEYLFEPIGVLTSWLKRGKVDMVICFSTDYEEIFQCQVLKKFQMVPSIVMSKKHPLAKKKKIGLEDIQDEIIYSFSVKYAKDAHNLIIRDFLNAGVNPKHFVMKDDLKTIEAAVTEGNGVAISFKEMFMNAKVLKFYPLASMNEGRTVNLILMWKDRYFDTIVDKYICREFG